MKNLSVKHLKKQTRTLYLYKGEYFAAGETTQTTGTDPTNTTITMLTTTHIFKDNGK